MRAVISQPGEGRQWEVHRDAERKQRAGEPQPRHHEGSDDPAERQPPDGGQDTQQGIGFVIQSESASRPGFGEQLDDLRHVDLAGPIEKDEAEQGG